MVKSKILDDTTSFQEWARATMPGWADQLMQLGASWDSFRGDDDNDHDDDDHQVNLETVVRDLVEGGIPRLASRSICHQAMAELRRNKAPMAIFWDTEAYPIPANTTSVEIVERIRRSVARYGSLVQFRCYTSNPLGLSAKELSDLLGLECHIVEYDAESLCTKECMVIVDAMQFAHTNDPATIGIVAEPARYSYLISNLKQWHTTSVTNHLSGTENHHDSRHGTKDHHSHHQCEIGLDWKEIGFFAVVEKEVDAVSLRPPGYAPLLPVEGETTKLQIIRLQIERTGCQARWGIFQKNQQIMRVQISRVSWNGWYQAAAAHRNRLPKTKMTTAHFQLQKIFPYRSVICSLKEWLLA